MGKNFHMIMKNDIYVSILLFLRLTVGACMRKMFKKNDFVWNVYQVLFLNYFLKWVHGFFFIYSVFEGYQLFFFFFYMYTWLQWNPNFTVVCEEIFFFVILVRLFLYHGINSHLVLNPYSQLVSADKIFTHIPRAGTQCLGLNLLKSFATLKIMGYLDRISVYTY